MAASLANHCHKQRQQVGLTLIEVLIALAIAGIAMMAVIKTTSQNIRYTGYLQNKTMAMWVAQQVLNEARVGVFKVGGSTGNQRLTTEMLGREWYWQAEEEDTANPRIKKITVKVFANETEEEDESSIATLESYVTHES